MTIASAIATKQQQVADSYTAVSNKGGTLPATQNLSNLATAISSIPSGGGSQTKYGANINTFLGNVNANGVLQQPTEQSDLVFTGVTDVTDYALAYKFYNLGVKSVSFPDLTTISGSHGCYFLLSACTSLTSISLPKLATVSGQNGCYYMFRGCTSLTSISLPKLTTVSGQYGCYYMFSNTGLTSISLPKLATVSGQYGCSYMFQVCTGITSVSLPELTTVSGQYGCFSMFISCGNLVSVSFPKLSDVSGRGAFSSAFNSCINITDIYFNALTTTSFGNNVNQFNMFNSGTSGTAVTSGNVTLHFPSNMQSTIAGLSGYPNFGATAGRVTLAYDLTATS